MDLTFLMAEGTFNIRTSAVFYRDGKLLAKRKALSGGPGRVQYSLPGGRVQLHETVEQAVVREIQEELGIAAKILRPLWVCQNFYTEAVSHTRCHELCFYFWMDASGLPHKQPIFLTQEGTRTHLFEWLHVEALKDVQLVPEFLKQKDFDLSEEFALITDRS
ncbi:MAG: NUDIX hydrolase [Faecalibacterium sp.]